MKYLSLLVLLTINQAFAASIDFYLDTLKVKTFEAAEFKKGEIATKDKTLKAEKSEIYNPVGKYTKTYEGYDFVALLDQVYGTDWRTAKSVRFVDQDGYFYSVKVKDLINTAKNHPGYLTYTEAGKDGFTEYKVGKQMYNPGPFYLVWKKFESRGLASYGDNMKWTSQLKEIYVLK